MTRLLLRCPLVVALVGLMLCTSCSWGGSSPFRRDGAPESPTTRVEPDSDSLVPSGADPKTLSQEALNPRLPRVEVGEDSGSLYYLADPGDDEFALAGFETKSPVRTPEEGTWTAPTTPEPPPAWTPEAPGPEPPGTEAPNDPLAEARARKEKAFERYTRLVTTGGEGDVQEALREYREAAARLKELEGR